VITPCTRSHTPNARTRKALRDADAGKNLTRYVDEDDLFKKLKIKLWPGRKSPIPRPKTPESPPPLTLKRPRNTRFGPSRILDRAPISFFLNFRICCSGREFGRPTAQIRQ
jgi:hypothetical protein